MTGTRRLRADHVVTPDAVLHDTVVEIDGSRLRAVATDTPPGAKSEHVRGWLVPGFVDTHVHGGGGFDYASVDPEEAVQARAFHAAHGTTTSFASLLTAPLDVLCRQLSTLADLADDGQFAGIHLEGPFLSAKRAGAHEPSLLRPPDPAVVERLLSAGRGHVAMVTLAPELPGALDAIRQLRAAGVTVAVGHTDADDETVATALDAGANVGTHVFNAMPSIHHRQPGPVPRLLTDPRVGVELIADGFHLHPEVLRMAASAAGPERTVLVTDAMAAAGMPGGQFRLGGLEVTVSDGMARLTAPDNSGAIAGSTLTMADAFRCMTAVVRDVAAVAALASTNAVRRFGLDDVGRIEAGCRADLCVVDDSGTLQRVMRSGQWLPEPA